MRHGLTRINTDERKSEKINDRFAKNPKGGRAGKADQDGRMDWMTRMGKRKTQPRRREEREESTRTTVDRRKRKGKDERGSVEPAFASFGAAAFASAKTGGAERHPQIVNRQ